VQLVCYPIVNLRRLRLGARAYVEGLEDTVVASVGQYGLQARVRHLADHTPLSSKSSVSCNEGISQLVMLGLKRCRGKAVDVDIPAPPRGIL